MKNSIIILITVISLFLVSCVKEVDWAPVNVSFYVQDSNGNDLLNPNTDMFIGDKIVLTYKGEDYTYQVSTKTYLPMFHGLTINLNSINYKYYAGFGEFRGDARYDDDFLITLPDGSTHKIHYDRRLSPVGVSAHQKWYLDGKKVEQPITIMY